MQRERERESLQGIIALYIRRNVRSESKFHPSNNVTGCFVLLLLFFLALERRVRLNNMTLIRKILAITFSGPFFFFLFFSYHSNESVLHKHFPIRYIITLQSVNCCHYYNHYNYYYYYIINLRLYTVFNIACKLIEFYNYTFFSWYSHVNIIASNYFLIFSFGFWNFLSGSYAVVPLSRDFSTLPRGITLFSPFLPLSWFISYYLLALERIWIWQWTCVATICLLW